MNTSKKIISLLMCMLMVLTMVPMSVFAESEKTLMKFEVTQEPYKLPMLPIKLYYTIIRICL